MKTVTEVRYSKKFNIGNYESEEFGAVANVEKGENPEKTLKTLKKLVHDMWAESSNKTTKSDDDESVSEEVSDTEVNDDENENSDEAGGQKIAAKAPDKKFKKKGSAYSRTNDTHKMLFAELLLEVCPGWKKDADTKAQAKDASMELDGQDFLDADGEVLPEFTKKLKKLMK